MWMSGLCIWTHLASVCPSAMWADEGTCVGKGERDLSLGSPQPGSGELLGIWERLAGVRTGAWGGGDPMIAVETSPGQEGHLLGVSRLSWGRGWPPWAFLSSSHDSSCPAPAHLERTHLLGAAL